MKKIVLITLVMMILSPLFAATVDYVYPNSISSVTFDQKPKVGNVFKDSKNSVLVVKDVRDDAVIFDALYSKGHVNEGSELYPAKIPYRLGAEASLSSVGVSFSALLPYAYPFEPMAKMQYNFKTGFNLHIGVLCECPLSSIVASDFTLFEDASLLGWAGLGITGKYFSVICGFDYLYSFGSWYVGLGGQWTGIPKTKYTSVIPKLAAGVVL